VESGEWNLPIIPSSPDNNSDVMAWMGNPKPDYSELISYGCFVYCTSVASSKRLISFRDLRDKSPAIMFASGGIRCFWINRLTKVFSFECP
jgi:hypothetical protein